VTSARLVTGSPVFKPERALFDRFDFGRHAVFSYARHGFIQLFRYLRARRDGHPGRLLFPNYMCHEVTGALRNCGFEIDFYPVDENFDIQVPELGAKLSDSGRDLLACVVFQPYGHVGRDLDEVQKLCDGQGVQVVEDCAHVPFPHVLESGLRPRWRVYTLRKTYPLPYGAAVTWAGSAGRFEDFSAGLPANRGGALRFLLRWVLREQIKRAVLASSIPVTRKYVDLSLDPLKEFDRPSRLLSAFLARSDVETVVQSRRRNLDAYRKLAPLFARWAQPFGFAPGVDIPYQYLLVLRQGFRPEEVAGGLLKLGVPAVTGLAIEDQVLMSLPPEHAFRRLVALPIHQDLSSSHFEKIEEALNVFNADLA